MGWATRTCAALLSGALFSAAVEDASVAASVDDECLSVGQGAEGDGHCAFSALQRRGGLAGVREHRDAAASAAACYDVKDDEGGACATAIAWAKSTGYAQHPDWYPEIKDPAAASTADWQYYAWNTGNPQCPMPCSGLGNAYAQAEASLPKSTGADCHDMQEGEPGACMNAINWAKNIGYPQHPSWYPGIDPATATLADWQFFNWNTTHPTCPKPCSGKAKAAWDAAWCDSLTAPELWKPDSPSKPVQVKILSYNLYWWNLFRQQGGLSAARLIQRTGEKVPYDVMGLQECEDPAKVFGPAGLSDEYEAFNTSKATCMAYRNSTWTLLEGGEDEVAMDMRTEYYGHRSAQWMRLEHKATGMKLLFVNHHGPLSVNSGGACGGKSTAHNLIKVMAKRGRKGDTVVLVGDFNANAASQTVQDLWHHLTHVYNSKSFGGVDNIFSNAPRKAIIEAKELGSGGSDHHAISAVIELPEGLAEEESKDPEVFTVAAAAADSEPAHALNAIEHALGSDACMLEPKGMYVYAAGGWMKHQFNIVDPRACCTTCEAAQECASWTWEEWNDNFRGPLCTLHGSTPLRTEANLLAVSGLPKGKAMHKALSAYAAIK